MSGELTPEQERFAEWLATPKPARRPQFEKEMAAQLGVSSVTTRRWKTLTSVRERVEELVYEAVGGLDRVRMVVDKVFEDAMSGSVKDKQLFLQFAGVLVNRSQVETANVDYAEMTDEELDAEIEAGWDESAERIFDNEFGEDGDPS
jgi:hypothetical protein